MNQMRGSRVHVTTWIVGVDGSRDAAIALRWATDMAAQTSGDIVPVCAWYVPLPIFALAGRRSVDVDRAGLEATANVAANASIDMSVRDGASPERIGELTTLEGHPSEVLLDLAGDGRVVVVGRRGIGHFRHRVLGSVSRDLATHARGPVAIVPDEWEHRPCRSVVVGFDGSDYSQAAL